MKTFYAFEIKYLASPIVELYVLGNLTASHSEKMHTSFGIVSEIHLPCYI